MFRNSVIFIVPDIWHHAFIKRSSGLLDVYGFITLFTEQTVNHTLRFAVIISFNFVLVSVRILPFLSCTSIYKVRISSLHMVHFCLVTGKTCCCAFYVLKCIWYPCLFGRRLMAEPGKFPSFFQNCAGSTSSKFNYCVYVREPVAICQYQWRPFVFLFLFVFQKFSSFKFIGFWSSFSKSLLLCPLFDKLSFSSFRHTMTTMF